MIDGCVYETQMKAIILSNIIANIFFWWQFFTTAIAKMLFAKTLKKWQNYSHCRPRI